MDNEKRPLKKAILDALETQPVLSHQALKRFHFDGFLKAGMTDELRDHVRQLDESERRTEIL